MNGFLNYITFLGGRLLINLLIWGAILLVLFIVIGLLIGVAQVILGGTADILWKYTAIILIGTVIYQTFNYITDEEPYPHEEV